MDPASLKTSDRKKDHIELAFQAHSGLEENDSRFEYDPLHAIHPKLDGTLPSSIAGKSLKFPIWISSMTGGTEHARKINQQLAMICQEFGLGMGLGSCRKLIEQPELFEDFDVRDYIGDQPLYANLGIAQLEQWVQEKKSSHILSIVDRLQADGLIIHVNPMQEWMQEEGDRILFPPIETIQKVLDLVSFPVIVKEVGQGFGYHSLKALLELPLAAVELGAYGGTNFALLELMRKDNVNKEALESLAYIGHSAEEMVDLSNLIFSENPNILCKQLILSGGIKNFLDGYYLMQKSNIPSIYGQASQFLKYAKADYRNLFDFVHQQTEGLKLAHAYLKIKTHIL
ncbi:MAG: isopentenyl-diphosphate delta-isomerase [Bacteroidota bacterium]|nr:isopentenyl-diphosphate delta-isomerase [Bacteroidota bacterium]